MSDVANTPAAQTPAAPTGEREAILSRVRSALATPTSPHVRHAIQSSSDYAALLPPGGATQEARVALFAARCAALKTDLHIVDSANAAAEKLRAIAAAEGWRGLAYHDHEFVTPAVRELGIESMQTTSGYDRAALERCDAGITACDALVAHTGSVMLTARSAGGRALSVLPPHHLVIATVDQLLPDVPAAYALFASRYGNDWPSFATLITGASRTGDIERILVLGAHGPKKLTIVLIV